MSASNRLFKQSNRFPKYTPLPWPLYFRGILAKDPVLWISAALALASSIAVRPPLASYADYIDCKTLVCLACLMAASGGFMLSGLFDRAAARLVGACGSSRALTSAMVAATFFASMFVTNDVALIVFVPMTLIAFKRAGCDPTLAVVLQTVAANVGSILLPMGNPQNLYLYSRYQMSFAPFFRTVLPLSLAGAAVLALFCLRMRKTPVNCPDSGKTPMRTRAIAFYSVLFLAAVLAVFDALDYRIALAATVVSLFAKGRNLAQQIDYALLLTFVFFFVFVGNIANVPSINEALTGMVGPRPYLAAIASSQIISNVPAAVLLSRFTADGHALLAGVSAGGCGTLIASMASLISYKLFMRNGGERSRYLLLFTLVNILFLVIMTLAYVASTAWR